MTRLVVATRNPGKVREFRQLLGSLPVEILAPSGMPEVEETGQTFSENAELKARAAAAWSGEWALADDSGLEVDTLGGAPGLRSSRFAGEECTDQERNSRLLEMLAGVPAGRRTARYQAAAALAAPDGKIWISEGTCEGEILAAPRGDGGFGYDPLFYMPALGRTMAELTTDEKNRHSHRARAVAGLRPVLERLCGIGPE